MYKSVDLHTHTTYSDGAFSPKELIDKAIAKGITVLGITDHDSVEGIEEAIEYSKGKGIEIIPGVELSTDIEDKEVHILGYFVNYKSAELIKYLKFFRDERYFRAVRIVNKLNKLNLDISIEDVMDVAKSSAVGRPHIAIAMMNKGIIKNFYEAFEKFIGDNGPAHERKIHVSPQSALKLLNDSGGLSFIAHPGHMRESILTSLINSGVDGIEVIHPSHNNYQIKFYRGIVNQYCLLESGGSDFHGGNRNDESNLGKHLTTTTKVEAMRNMLS